MKFVKKKTSPASKRLRNYKRSNIIFDILEILIF